MFLQRAHHARTRFDYSYHMLDYLRRPTMHSFFLRPSGLIYFIQSRKSIITKLHSSLSQKPRTHPARSGPFYFVSSKGATSASSKACCLRMKTIGSRNSELCGFMLGVCEIKSCIYTQIPGRDKDARRTYYKRAWTW